MRMLMAVLMEIFVGALMGMLMGVLVSVDEGGDGVFMTGVMLMGVGWTC
jgi:hypothetical protein